MPKRASPNRNSLPAGQLAIAGRLKEVRAEEKFSRAKLATDADITKSALAHYEAGRAPLTFAAGNAICRRLDLNQRWLATGEQPQRPFVDLSDIAGDGFDFAALDSMTFLAAVNGPLLVGFERWRAAHPDEALIARTLRGGIAELMRRQSDSGLEAWLSRFVSELRRESSATLKAGHREQIRAVLSEMERRAAGRISVDERNPMGSKSPVRISEKLKRARKRLALTQRQAAKKWGVPLSTLKKWEQGEREPRGLSLKHLETILRTARVE